jgi:hypothetical protein
MTKTLNPDGWKVIDNQEDTPFDNHLIQRIWKKTDKKVFIFVKTKVSNSKKGWYLYQYYDNQKYLIDNFTDRFQCENFALNFMQDDLWRERL